MEKRQKQLSTRAQKALRQVIKRMLANKTSRDILLGQALKNKEVLEKLMGIPKFRERVVKAILDERHARKTVMLAGQERCGSPSEEVKSRIESIMDLERLDRMLRRAVKASNWAEILETA